MSVSGLDVFVAFMAAGGGWAFGFYLLKWMVFYLTGPFEHQRKIAVEEDAR